MEPLNACRRPGSKVFVCASAMDFYGDTGNRAVSEEAAAGTGFLAGVCQRWEEAAAAYIRALPLCDNTAERAFVTQQLAAIRAAAGEER